MPIGGKLEKTISCIVLEQELLNFTIKFKLAKFSTFNSKNFGSYGFFLIPTLRPMRLDICIFIDMDIFVGGLTTRVYVSNSKPPALLGNNNTDRERWTLPKINRLL